MEKTLKVFAWTEIVIGGLGLLGSFSTQDFYQFVGGVIFLAAGIVSLMYIKEVKKAKLME